MKLPNNGRKTFSITEILISLVMLGTISSVAIPAWFGRSDVTLDNAARLLARDLRAAQNRAAFNGESTQLRFSGDGTGYSVFDKRGALLPALMGQGGFVREYPRDAVFRGVRVENADFAGQAIVEYNDRGVVQHDGQVVLSFAGDSRIVRVCSRTGLIELEGMAEAWTDSGL
ncbi:MAG: Tfp pilus assembly protein FimT [Planctomycetota bacterium]|jgi:Tfp pilus assembly protein FimT